MTKLKSQKYAQVFAAEQKCVMKSCLPKSVAN